MTIFSSQEPFELECGKVLPGIDIAHHTYGTLNRQKNNTIWICHALTADSNVTEWWPGMVGPGCVFDTSKYFVVCANIPGSCYGTTGPTSVNPATGKGYYLQFPLTTIRDIVKAHSLLAHHLGIEKIHLLAGGSMGGYQVLEWCAMESHFIENIFVIATSAQESAWGIAIHSAQRLAIEGDATWGDLSNVAGRKGLKAARAFGMVTYRSYSNYIINQSEDDMEKLEGFKSSSYIEYQGQKFINRFDAYSYWYLTKTMDSHNLARGRASSVEEVLHTLLQKTLILGITSDLLCPLREQEFLAAHIPHSSFYSIESNYGHDGFLTETTKISKHLKDWFSLISL